MIMKAGKKYVKLVYDENGHAIDTTLTKRKKDADDIKSPAMQHLVRGKYGIEGDK